MWVLRDFFSLFNYLRMFEPLGVFRSKRMYEFVLPAMFFSLFLLCSMVFGFTVEKEFLNSLFLQVAEYCEFLAPFFLTVLAAFAFLPNSRLDDQTRGRGVFIKYKMNGRTTEKRVTRRELVSSLFGYIVVICIFIWIFAKVESSFWVFYFLFDFMGVPLYFHMAFLIFILAHLVFLLLFSLVFLSGRALE